MSLETTHSETQIEKISDETKRKLQNLADEVISKIQQDKDYYEKNSSLLTSIWEKLEKKEYLEAFFAFIQGLMQWFSLNAKSGFKHLESEIQKLNLWAKKTEELYELISKFEKEIKNQKSSLSDLTDETFLMSLCKDRVLEQHCLKHNLNSPTPYDKLKYHLLTPKEKSIWKVLLFNVWSQGKWDSWLETSLKTRLLHPMTQSISGSWFQHAAIISKIDPTGEIYITHANSKWVIEESLSEYLSRDSTMIDIMSLIPPEGYGEKATEFAKSKLWAKYDTLGMAYDAISWERKAGEKGNSTIMGNKQDLFYCSELIFEGFKHAWLQAEKKLFSPWDLISLLTPEYCSSFDSNNLETKIKFKEYETLNTF